ncbi:hypothetical protein DKT77_17810 [Meridianimarinicoccus roseus]|uniref:Uncharacterized protein n=1 Tax=Meridianimarinicoccus roseus TaxID=2072018 RepID=A0A2V2LDB5_9RHOB|nr:site-specific integrase [Meridianimarinicoccus roseus]PWR01286.1 hypothetical protein DKT77_17810 [Meridianimarinicoccus roseus]
MPLTVKEIEAARFGVQKERLGDGAGLFVRLYPSGRKSFQVLVSKGDGAPGRVWVALGDFPDITLKAARGRAVTVRGWSSEGLGAAAIRRRLTDHPEIVSPKRTTATNEVNGVPGKRAATFRQVAQVWFDRKRLGLKNGKHIAQNWSTIETYVLPTLGDRCIDDIKVLDVVEVFRPIWHVKNETARRTLGRVREVFELAKLEHGLQSNPADFSVDVAYGKLRRRTKHFGALDPESVPTFWEWLQDVHCDEDTRHLVGLMLLSAKRTGEVRFAEWRFFSQEDLIWTTPAELMKMGRAHRAPVSRQARVLLDNMRMLNGEKEHVFAKPRNRSGVICENAARLLVKRFEAGATGHGFRAAFKTWARGQRRYLPDAIEMALAHEPAKLEAAYQRADLLEERVALMQDWADFVTGGADPRSLGDLSTTTESP